MAKTSRSLRNRATYGTAVLTRIAQGTVPPLLKADLATFKSQHAAYLAADKLVSAAHKARDAKLGDIAKLDAVRDASILTLANALPNAGIGTRTNPFDNLIAHSPSRLVALGYADESHELETLLDGLVARGVKGDVAKLVATCRKQSAAVDAELDALTAPEAALNQARSARDGLIADWSKALQRLEETAKVAYRGVAGRTAAIFAEAPTEQAAAKPKKKKKTATKTPTDPGAGTQSVAMAKVAKKKRKRRTR